MASISCPGSLNELLDPSDLYTLMEQARNIVSQLSQVSCLAFSATVPQNLQLGKDEVVFGTSPFEGQTTLGSPAKIIGLLESLLSRLLPPLFARLGSVEAREITLAVANGIIKPIVNALIAVCALPSGQDDAEQPRMVDRVTSLLHSLLPISSARTCAQSASVSANSAETSFPFAEMISLWSTDLVYAKVMHSIDQDSKDTTRRATIDQQSIKNPTLNALINTILGIVGRCIRYPFGVASSDYQADDQMPEKAHQGSYIRLVNTRICDKLTRLIAELGSEIGTASQTEPAPCSSANASTSLPIHDVEESVTGNPKLGRALWESIGLEKGTWLAMCCVAEQMMISEEAEIGAENLSGSSVGWLEEICGEQQDWRPAR